jgi:hypothetical protein
LEFGVSAILEALIDRSQPAIGDVITDRNSISKNLELINRLLPFRTQAISGARLFALERFSKRQKDFVWRETFLFMANG